MKGLKLSANNGLEPADQALKIGLICKEEIKGSKKYPVFSTYIVTAIRARKNCIKWNELRDPFLLVAFFLTFAESLSFYFAICSEAMPVIPLIPRMKRDDECTMLGGL